MATNKTATLTFRIDPALKEALRAAAEQQHRSIANMVEVLIRDYCEHKGISIRELSTQFSNEENEKV
ncbi:TPA: ribbon-helix-helix protein, CopG family [Legionella pneumophila]|uniref:ribbon-helix-helix protein, CopG family n=1 Tax=Legionella pneumophila TaxID=446 RepID=UPI001C17630E|nr:ribbon-helix-helix protein, CopG family [Legionella pneumophila]